MNENYTSVDYSEGKNHKGSRLKTLSAELRYVFNIEEIKAEVQFWKKMKDCLREQPVYTSKNISFNRICGLCLACPEEPKLYLKFRNTGLRRLDTFLLNSTKKEVQSKDIKLLIWCCLSLLSFFFSKRQEDKCTCYKRQKLEKCKVLFLTALYLVLPEKQEEVIKFTIRFVTLTSQWNSEDYDVYVFQEMFSITTRPELLVAKILKQIETSQREEDLKEAFNIACTLSSLLEHAHWDKYLFNHLLHNCFNTFLKLYLLCNNPVPSALKIDNIKLRMAIKSCIKYFMNNIRDNKGLVSVLDSIAKCLHDATIGSEDRREIMEMLVFCAQKHQTTYYRESITPDLLDLLLTNLFSDNKVLVMSSHKVVQHIMDRHGNDRHFIEPVYFFKGLSNFTINYDFSIEDIHFLKSRFSKITRAVLQTKPPESSTVSRLTVWLLFRSFSKRFLEGIQHCFLTFTEKYCLITWYVTLCIVLVEVPDPVITINIIHVLITIQDDVLKSDDLPMTVKAHIHAIISSLASLICVIHQDEVSPLKKYIDGVIRYRTENSPHLLPPLQNKYTVASHHTVDYHEQLYFLENEILYALQRCWLSKRVTLNK